MDNLTLLLEKLSSLLDILASSFISQKYNNFQHYQISYSDNTSNNTITIPSKSAHSISISSDKINKSSPFPNLFSVKIMSDKIVYQKGFNIEASTLIEGDIVIEVLPNTLITIIKQF